MWRHLFASWNPNKYQHVRDLSIGKLLLLVFLTSILSAAIFWLLLIPNVLDADDTASELSKTTNITLNAHLTQSAPTYLFKNPDVLITTTDGEGLVVITPEDITVKQFVFFGKESYDWKQFSSLSEFPARAIATKLLLFLYPSLVIWTAAGLFVYYLILVLLFSFIAYFVLHAKNFHITYSNVWKPALYASIPALLLTAATPVLRFGLPLAMIWGLCFVLWLVLSLLGTTLIAEKHPDHVERKPEKRRA